MKIKALMISVVLLTLTGCKTLGDTTVTRGGDNQGTLTWEVSQVFKWGK